jgi:osmotically-inducible protein OsmY
MSPTDTPPGNDPDLMALVLAALQAEGAPETANLSVEFVEGSLILRGTAASAEERDRATALVRQVTGDVPVENRMRVG